jgi:Tol biopolymer transport system component
VTANSENAGISLGFPEEAMMSSNQRHVVFTSDAPDLATNAAIGWRDVFVRDLVAEKTQLVSVSADGISGGNDYSHGPMISSNGMVIAFNSQATNLVPICQCEGYINVFVRDLAAGITRLVSKGLTEPANGHSSLGGLSADGRFVLFWSDGSNLVIGDTNGIFSQKRQRS